MNAIPMHNPILGTTPPPPGIILLVDDDPSNLAVLSRLLQPHYDVLAAPSGERALEIAARPRSRI